MKIKIVGNLAYIYTPYNSEFVRKIRRCGNAHWNSSANAWTVNTEYIPAVRKMMCDVYGESDIPADKRVDVKLTFHEDYEATCDGVFFFGRCLARAYSRDSGAKVGEGVCYLDGSCKSGGSAKYWSSIVKEGSVVMLYGVPEVLIQKEARVENVDYEIIERCPDENALLTEKSKLLTRVAEIDAMLQSAVPAHEEA